MKKVLLVDINSIFYRSYSSLYKRIPNAIDSRGNPCVGTYGFFTTFFKTLEQLKGVDGYVFAYDCIGSTSIRKELSTEYKSNRKQKSSHFYKDLDNLLKTYIPMLGILPLGKQGYEADDIIASACRYISSVTDDTSVSIYILSGDGDLEQCAIYNTPKVSIFWVKTQPSWGIWDTSKVLSKWGVNDAKYITLLKAITGDSSDFIKGVKGYKKAKALKVFRDESFLSENKELIERNISLIKLKDDLDVCPRAIDLSKENLFHMFTYMNSKTLLSRINKIYA